MGPPACCVWGPRGWKPSARWGGTLGTQSHLPGRSKGRWHTRRLTEQGPIKDGGQFTDTPRDCEACWGHKGGSTPFLQPFKPGGLGQEWGWSLELAEPEQRGGFPMEVMGSDQPPPDRQTETETHQPLKSISVQFYCKRREFISFQINRVCQRLPRVLSNSLKLFHISFQGWTKKIKVLY